MFTTPILFLVFNRPDNTRKVFEQIRKIQPAYLYIAADGSRKDKPGEDKLCAEVRNILLSNIDWECEVKTLFRDENLGCGKAVSQAITWFFENVEEGIILEDDCLPDQSFFYYCDELLEKFRFNENVISIGGTNFNYRHEIDQSYNFSGYMNMWGWATWKRNIPLVDYEMNSWKKIKFKYPFLLSRLHRRGSLDIRWLSIWRNLFDLTSSGKIDTWDYQWIYAQLYNKKISIFPSRNLINNIGFSDNATHTKESDHPITKVELQKLHFPLKHPNKLEIDYHYEEEYIKTFWFNHKNRTLLWILKTKILSVPIIYRLYSYRKNIS
jgi:hypothetical protein